MPEVTISDVMKEYAAGAVKYAKRTRGVNLDYSESSLDEIDKILIALSAPARPDPARMTTAEKDELWVFCKMIGGYVGEVIIRCIGGEWMTKSTGEKSSAVVLKVAGGKVEGSPPESVWRTLTEPDRSIASYYRGLKALIDLQG